MERSIFHRFYNLPNTTFRGYPINAQQKSENQSSDESNFYVYMQIIKNKNFYTLAPVSALGLASFLLFKGYGQMDGWLMLPVCRKKKLASDS